MEEIYNLVGKNLQAFQKLEELFAILIYLYTKDKIEDVALSEEIRKKALLEFSEMDSKTLGYKKNKIRELNIIDNETDNIVFNYLTDKRNYLVHNFYLENKFDSEEEVKAGIEELNKTLSDVTLINTALHRIIISIVKSE